MIVKKLKNDGARILKRAYLVTRGALYSGNNYHCPICRRTFRKMLPGGFDLEVNREKQIIGSGYRLNNICPYCQSTDRDRLVFLYLKNETQLFNSKLKVLHASPEPSLFNFLKKQKNLDYVIGTKYSEGIYYPKNISSFDLLDLPFKDEEFDVVICNHVLEHIIDDGTAMKEIFRVLKKGGFAILQVPYSNILQETYEDDSIVLEKDREKYFGQFDHVRIYGKDYSSRLEKAGFNVMNYRSEEIPDNEGNKYAVNLKEKLFIGGREK